MKHVINRIVTRSWFTLTAILAVGLFLQATDVFAQSAVGVIEVTIRNMVSILNIIIVGVMAWSGFLLARGDSSAVQRIIYGIVGLVVVNFARVFIEFFI